MRLVIFLLLSGVALTGAKAEFVMLPQPEADLPEHASTGDAIPPHAKPRAQSRRSPSSEPVLVGFGAKVPLSFAVRQIMPARFHVVFDSAVDRDASVDWKGGKRWRTTLADALKPLGLAGSVTGQTLTIRPTSTSR
jgi:hypothetical protein